MLKIESYNSIKSNNFQKVKNKSTNQIYFRNSRKSSFSNELSFSGNHYFAKLEAKYLFEPNTTNFSPIPKSLERVMHKIKTKTEDGLTLEHYYIPSTEGKKTVIFCHGKKRNATDHFDIAEVLHQNGYGVLMAEYRGFGTNPGIPSEKGLYKDLNSVIAYLEKEKTIPQNQMVLWGFSLGGGVVSEAAQSNKFGGIILNSTFTDINHAVKYLMTTGKLKVFDNKFLQKAIQLLPARMIPVENRFATYKKMKTVRTKTFIVHSKDDNTIPYQMSKKLAKITPNSELYIAETGGHNANGWANGAVINFLDSLI